MVHNELPRKPWAASIAPAGALVILNCVAKLAPCDLRRVALVQCRPQPKSPIQHVVVHRAPFRKTQHFSGKSLSPLNHLSLSHNSARMMYKRALRRASEVIQVIQVIHAQYHESSAVALSFPSRLWQGLQWRGPFRPIGRLADQRSPWMTLARAGGRQSARTSPQGGQPTGVRRSYVQEHLRSAGCPTRSSRTSVGHRPTSPQYSRPWIAAGPTRRQCAFAVAHRGWLSGADHGEKRDLRIRELSLLVLGCV
jgi:hypothetical protein